MGKTRLAEEVLAAAEAEDRWCVRAVASERTRQVPLGAVAHLLPARILLDRSDPLTLFPKVAETVKARGKGRRVVLLIDDLHLLDSTTATLTGQLLDARLNFLVGTVRSGEPVPNNVAALWRDDRMVRVDLGDFSPDELEILLRTALGGPIATDAVDSVWAVSQGNLLYTRELVLAAIDGGQLRRGPWRLAAGGTARGERPPDRRGRSATRRPRSRDESSDRQGRPVGAGGPGDARVGRRCRARSSTSNEPVSCASARTFDASR